MPTLAPFRDYDEKDIINIYALSGTTLPVQKGTLVKITGDGLKLDEPNPIEMLGNYGDFSVSNVVSQRYGVVPKVGVITAQTDRVIGMTLFDVRETDENGELLKYRPRKAAEMEAVLSGQAVPLVTRGIFSYSGITTGASLTGVVSAGAPLYPGSNGALTTASFTEQNYGASGVPMPGRPIGRALGKTDAKGFTVIWLNITAAV